MASLKSLFSVFSPRRRKPRLFIDACNFDPDQEGQGDALILYAKNEEDRIFARVSSALCTASRVIVVDQGSTDSTPYLAAEAGAIVVVQNTE